MLRQMSTAPTDGTRFLALEQVYHFKRRGVFNDWVKDGTRVRECWFDGSGFTPWCGNPNVSEIPSEPEYLGWVPMPEELQT